MFKEIRVQNLRSLTDTGYIKTKPLTVLVGKNSCGKSTFARTFPLLRQSSEEKTRTSILWFGRYVDFGDFNDAITSGEDEITFSFKLSFTSDDLDYLDESYLFFFEDSVNWLGSGTIECSLTLARGERSQYTKRLKAKIFDTEIAIEADEQRTITTMTIDDEEISVDNSEENRAVLSEGKILPSPTFLTRSKRQATHGHQRKNIYSRQPTFKQSLIDELTPLMHGRTKKNKLNALISYLGLGSRVDLKEHLLRNTFMGKHFNKNISEIPPNSIKFKRIHKLTFAHKIESIFRFADTEISDHFRNVKYIEPLRATAERYYRVQDLAVDEIDPRGSNIAMYIKGLSEKDLSRFNEWCSKTLNFGVSYEQNPGHMAIKIIENSNERNITDMGFGYSQLLPIAMHIWNTSYNSHPEFDLFSNPKDNRTTIVIEQPELHLHPAFQAKIADIFASAAKANKKNGSSIIIETHSSHLINRLGELIVEEVLQPEDIQVILFERGHGEDKTEVNISCFDEDGVLRDWPVGFMQPE